MIITNSRYALVGYFITSYPTRAHGIIVIYSNNFRGASIECRDKDKDTPLLMAASKNHLETIKSLLSHGADIGAKDSNDETPIYRAASEGCIEALEVR